MSAAELLSSLELPNLLKDGLQVGVWQVPGGLVELVPDGVAGGEVSHRHLQRGGELVEHVESRDEQPALQLAHVATSKPQLLYKGVEGPVLLLAELAHPLAYGFGQWIWPRPVLAFRYVLARHPPASTGAFKWSGSRA